MAQIFISYRRADSQANTDRIYGELRKAFGRDAIFKDVDDIPLGADFPTYLAEKVDDAKVVLVVIGRQWATIAYDNGDLRLHDPEDFVRIEVETALALPNATVIPILVNNANMPSPDALPESIKALPRLNAITVRNDPDFFNDSQRLIRRLREMGSRAKRPSWIPLTIIFALVAIAIIAGLILTQSQLPNTVTQVAQNPTETSSPTTENTPLPEGEGQGGRATNTPIPEPTTDETQVAIANLELTQLAYTDTPTPTILPTDTPTNEPTATPTSIPTQTPPEPTNTLTIDEIAQATVDALATEIEAINRATATEQTRIDTIATATAIASTQSA